MIVKKGEKCGASSEYPRRDFMKLVLWFQIIQQGGVGYLNYAVSVLERLYGEVKIVGVILDTPFDLKITELNIIDKQELKNIDYDLILVAGGEPSLVPLFKQADELGIDLNKTVLDRTVLIPLFTMEKYNQLRHSRLSIISRDCFGGLIYHRLGLPFLSPTINMSITEEDFLKFLKDPVRNMNSEPILSRTAFEVNLHFEFPIYKIGGVEWNMNHYSDFDFALKKWHERRYKMNWFNTLVVMNTTNPDILAEFDELPFAKKICFVPFETDLESGFYIDREKYRQYEIDDGFARITRLTATGELVLYDVWDLLLYGKKTPLV